MNTKSKKKLNSKYHDIINFHGSNLLTWLTFLTIILAAGYQFQLLYVDFYSVHSASEHINKNINSQLAFFSILFPLLTITLYLIYFMLRKKKESIYFTALFLMSTFTLLISWRLSATANMLIPSYIYLAAFILDVLNYLVCANNDIKDSKKNKYDHIYHNSKYEWQLLFIRMIIGFILVPHFTEKLFSGDAIRLEDVKGFTSMGLYSPLLSVYLAGIIEFCCCFGIACGFLTRLAALGAFLYLMIASYFGGHFNIGFIWALDGGGWEYPALWSVLVLSFVLYGGDGFSLDRVLKEKLKVPGFIKFLMG